MIRSGHQQEDIARAGRDYRQFPKDRCQNLAIQRQRVGSPGGQKMGDTNEGAAVEFEMSGLMTTSSGLVNAKRGIRGWVRISKEALQAAKDVPGVQVRDP
jgi:hypothetical protein